MTVIKTPFDAKTQVQSEAKKAQSDKLRKLGAVGTLRHARRGEQRSPKYGGTRYATGGAVGEQTGRVEGGAAPRRIGHGRREAHKGKEGAHTSIMIVAGGHPPAPPAGPAGPMGAMPHPPMAGPPPGAMAAAGPPPGAGPMPGGPPMKPPGMAATGGAIRYARGGKASGSTDWLEATTKEGDREKERMYGKGEREAEKDAYAKGGSVKRGLADGCGPIPVGSKGAKDGMEEQYGSRKPYHHPADSKKGNAHHHVDDEFTHADTTSTKDKATEHRFMHEKNFRKGGAVGEEKMKPREANEKHDEEEKLPGTGRGGKEAEDGAAKTFGRASGGGVGRHMTAGASSGVGLLQKSGKKVTPIRGGDLNVGPWKKGKE